MALELRGAVARFTVGGKIRSIIPAIINPDRFGPKLGYKTKAQDYTRRVVDLAMVSARRFADILPSNRQYSMPASSSASPI